MTGFGPRGVQRFDRTFFRSGAPIMRIGDGEPGGKASGLVRIRDLLEGEFDASRFPRFDVYVPRMVVIATDVFDMFVERNGLQGLGLSGASDAQIGHEFQEASLPVEITGDLRALVEEVRTPLAVRSSSLLEDTLLQPFAGVYETKMLSNNQPDADTRFRRLVEAIKLVWASTWSEAARSYLRATSSTTGDEKMAVVIQEVVGTHRTERFYPTVSGVGRSYNFFPAKGVLPQDGAVNLALGLGKTIVDGGTSWIFSPSRPNAPPPFGSVREMLRDTQRRFWAVNMGRASAYDPLADTEDLVQLELSAADYDSTLAKVASTYDAGRDRVVPGTAVPGPRVIDFAPLLKLGVAPVNKLIAELMSLGERALDEAVEIEFAVDFPQQGFDGARFGFLQLRPMLVSREEISIEDAELTTPDLLLSSARVMGNGAPEGVRDVIYVKPDVFEARHTAAIAGELDVFNQVLLGENRPYLLLGFGRWGSTDPWLGIPVRWDQIAGARVIVESTLAGMDVEASQGAHFFHNLISFRALYLCVSHHAEAAAGGVNWARVAEWPAVRESEHVRHVRLEHDLRIKVDGRSGRGAVWDRSLYS